MAKLTYLLYDMLYGKTDMLLWGQASVLQPPVSGKRPPRQFQHEAVAGRFIVFTGSEPEPSMKTAMDGGSSATSGKAPPAEGSPKVWSKSRSRAV